MLVIAVISLVGLSLGSFLTVCAYRIPRKIPILGRSFCPDCRQTLSWYELIPLVSFIIQRGKCRSCSSRIPIRYPLVETISIVLALLLFNVYGLSPQFLLSFSFLSLMILVAVIDWQHMVIPNSIVISGLVIGLGLNAIFYPETILDSLAASIAAFGILYVVRSVGGWLFSARGASPPYEDHEGWRGSARSGRKEAMGFGDVKLAAVLGLFLGLQGFLAALWSAAILGVAYAKLNPLAPPSLTKRRGMGDEFTKTRRWRVKPPLPFGSFVAFASALVFMLSDFINTNIEQWLTSLQ